MGYTKSQFTGNLERIGNAWVYSIDSNDEKTWVRIHIDDDAEERVLFELQYIIENLKEFVVSISESAKTGKGDGVYISGEDD